MKIKTKEKPGAVPAAKSAAELAAPFSTNAAEPSPIEAPIPVEKTPPPVGEFKIVPRSLVQADPNQPRKEFEEGPLEELAWSIYEHGIQQPPVVQLVPGLKLKEPDMFLQKNWEAVDHRGAVVFSGGEEEVKRLAAPEMQDRYQLIFGERRWRASQPRTFERNGQKIKWSGLAELPVIIREITEKDRFVLQFVENHQRVNLSALEEARAFNEQLEKRRAVDPGFSAEKLGDELGIKRGTVYNRLKLLRLHEPVRQALIAGKIEVSVATAIAAVPDVAKQKEILKKIEQEADYGEVMTFRAVEELIDDEYAKQLKGVPFDLEDDKLVKVRWQLRAGEDELVIDCPKEPRFVALKTIGALKLEPGASGRFDEVGRVFVVTADNFQMVGPIVKKQGKEVVEFIAAHKMARAIEVARYGGGACSTCPHRSGVMDPDSKTPNICMVPSCFDAKVKAHWVRKSEELKANGTEVLSEGEMRKRGKHVPADKYESWLFSNRSGTWKEVMGKHAPEPVLVATKEGIKKFFPEEDAIAAAKKNGVKFNSHAMPKTKADVDKANAAEKKREENKQRRQEIAAELLPTLAKALTGVDDKAAWTLLDAQEISKWNYEASRLKALVDAAKSPRARMLGKLFSETGSRLVDHEGEWNKDTVKLYQAVGIDVLAEEKKREATKPTAAELPLKKAEPKQKELLTVKKSRKPKGRKK